MTTHDRLMLILRDSGLSQAEIAERSGLTQATVSRILAGRSQPSLETAQRLARAVGCSLDLSRMARCAVREFARRKRRKG